MTLRPLQVLSDRSLSLCFHVGLRKKPNKQLVLYFVISRNEPRRVDVASVLFSQMRAKPPYLFRRSGGSSVRSIHPRIIISMSSNSLGYGQKNRNFCCRHPRSFLDLHFQFFHTEDPVESPVRKHRSLINVLFCFVT